MGSIPTWAAKTIGRTVAAGHKDKKKPAPKKQGKGSWLEVREMARNLQIVGSVVWPFVVLAAFVLSAMTMSGCAAARQQVVVEAPAETVACELEQVEVTMFTPSEREAVEQVESTGWRPIEVRQATLAPNGVRRGVWVVSATRRVCSTS